MLFSQYPVRSCVWAWESIWKELDLGWDEPLHPGGMKGEGLQVNHSFLREMIIEVCTEGHTVGWLGMSSCSSNNVKSYGQLKTPKVLLKSKLMPWDENLGDPQPVGMCSLQQCNVFTLEKCIHVVERPKKKDGEENTLGFFTFSIHYFGTRMTFSSWLLKGQSTFWPVIAREVVNLSEITLI